MRSTPRKATTTIIILAGLSMLSSACGDTAGAVEPPPPGRLVHSALERDLSPQVSDEDRSALAEGNTRFALDAYAKLRDEPGASNFVVSPYSLSLALAMTYAGARNQTADEMASALRFTLPRERLHPAFNAVDLDVTAATGDGVELRLLNQLFAQDGFSFEQPFLDTLARDYGAGVRLLDFTNAYEAARAAINGWVADTTHERIVELLPQGSLSAATRLVLANAIYFNGEWESPFPEQRTRTANFYLRDGGTRAVSMMHDTVTVPYLQGDGYRALELPYRGQRQAMLVIVPDPGRFDAVESSLDAAALEEIFAALVRQPLELGLPRFQLAHTVPAGRVLQSLGMLEAFDPFAADFSGIAGSDDPLHVHAVLHQAFISVGEKGTEAGAATGVIVGVHSAPTGLEIDRPFLFAIRDRATGSILFLGRLVEP